MPKHLSPDIPSYGIELSNQRNAPAERKLNSSNVKHLKLEWQFPQTPTNFFGVSQPPAIVDDIMYFGTDGNPNVGNNFGVAFAVNIKTHAAVWGPIPLGGLTVATQLGPIDLTPAVAKKADLVYFATAGSSTIAAGIFALSKTSGAIQGEATMPIGPTGSQFPSFLTAPVLIEEENILLITTGSGIAINTAPKANYIIAYNATPSGGVLTPLWIYKTTGGTSISDAGLGMFGGPAIDRKTGLLYVGTGEQYYDPVIYGNNPHQDSLLVLNYRTSNPNGELVWSYQFNNNDGILVSPDPIAVFSGYITPSSGTLTVPNTSLLHITQFWYGLVDNTNSTFGPRAQLIGPDATVPPNVYLNAFGSGGGNEGTYTLGQANTTGYPGSVLPGPNSTLTPIPGLTVGSPTNPVTFNTYPNIQVYTASVTPGANPTTDPGILTVATTAPNPGVAWVGQVLQFFPPAVSTTTTTPPPVSSIHLERPDTFIKSIFGTTAGKYLLNQPYPNPVGPVTVFGTSGHNDFRNDWDADFVLLVDPVIEKSCRNEKDDKDDNCEKKCKHFVIVGTKQGYMFGFDRHSRKLVWTTNLSGPSPNNSFESGVNTFGCSDGQVVYMPSIYQIDGESIQGTFGHSTQLGVTAVATAIVAVNALDGKILWKRDFNGGTFGPLSIANGVLYHIASLGSLSDQPKQNPPFSDNIGGVIRALDAKTGKTLFTYANAFSSTSQDADTNAIFGGVTIYKGKVYFPFGNAQVAFNTAGTGLLDNNFAGIKVLSLPKRRRIKRRNSVPELKHRKNMNDLISDCLNLDCLE